MELSGILASVVRWLRTGYPDGVPGSDYVPLFAVLSRRLSGDEVEQVLNTLALSAQPPIERVDIQVLITRITHELPSDEDIERVSARLAAAGWPVSGSLV